MTDLPGRTPRERAAGLIQQRVAAHYNIKLAEMSSPRRATTWKQRLLRRRKAKGETRLPSAISCGGSPENSVQLMVTRKPRSTVRFDSVGNRKLST